MSIPFPANAGRFIRRCRNSPEITQRRQRKTARPVERPIFELTPLEQRILFSTLPVFYPFDDSGTTGWTGGSIQTTTTIPTNAFYSSRSGSGTVTLSLTKPASDTNGNLSFTVFALDKWTGDAASSQFTVSVNGAPVVDTTFANTWGGSSPSPAGAKEYYPNSYSSARTPTGDPANNNSMELDNDGLIAGGGSCGGDVADSVYAFDVPISDAGPTLTITFSGPASTVEYFGLDNVTVTSAVAEPKSNAGAGVDPVTGSLATASAGPASGGMDGLTSGVTITSGAGAAADNGASVNVAGTGTVLKSLPALIQAGGGSLALNDGSGAVQLWSVNGSSWTPPDDQPGSLVYDAADHQYILSDAVGTKTTFYDFTVSPGPLQGKVKGLVDSAGNATAYAYDNNGNLLDVGQSATTGTVTTSQSEQYAYLGASDPNAGKLATITLLRKTFDTSLGQTDANTNFQPVTTSLYSYYSSGDSNGNAGDLKTVSIEDAGPAAPAVSISAGGSLSSSSTYYYVITATTALGESNTSAEVTASPTAGNQTANLSWPSFPHATGYNVYRGTTSGNETLLATLGLVNAWSDAGSASPGTTIAPVALTGTTYYRYYTPASAGTIGYVDGLKFVVGPQAFARLADSLPVTLMGATTPFTATDAQLAPFASAYYQYNSQEQVSQEVLAGAGGTSTGGLGAYTFSYANSDNGSGFNIWSTKTTETLPDGSVLTSYHNAWGQTMLQVMHDASTGLSTGTFTEYDPQDRPILLAGPSAVELPSSLSTLEANPDLLNNTGAYGVSPDYQYLSGSSGLVTITNYYSATTATGSTAGGVAGFVQNTEVQQGQGGSPILQDSKTYYARTEGGATIYPLATNTTYGTTGGGDPRTTTTTYGFAAGSNQVLWKEVQQPVITNSQDGPGSSSTDLANAATTWTYFDSFGEPTWTKDGLGYIDYTRYDPDTGAVLETITDVNTAITSDFSNLPASWTTYTGGGSTGLTPGGLNLVTTWQVDAQGRNIEEITPNGNVTCTVYNDPAQEIRVYPGFNASTGLTTGPIQDTISSFTMRLTPSGWAQYAQSATSSATPHLTGGLPDGSESLTGVVSLSRSLFNAAGQISEKDAYFSLAGSGVSYGANPHLGSVSNNSAVGNYHATYLGYDSAGRQDRIVAPTGTITRNVFDGIGQPLSTWVGTNDTGATSSDPTGGGAAGNNMTETTANQYDGGSAGDGDLTQVTRYPGGSAAARVTDNYYDWRDRLVATKKGVSSGESDGANRPIMYNTLDNLGEVMQSRIYDGDGVTITSTGGVPNAPSSSLLVADTANNFDDLGRAYQTTAFGVTAGTGAITTTGLATFNFFDANGNKIAAYLPGGETDKTSFDGANRPLTRSITDGGAANNAGTPRLGFADAGGLANDIVLTQTKNVYDGDGNATLAITSDRLPGDAATATGALGTPTVGVRARVSYIGTFYDAANFAIARENVGTNGGAAWTMPTSPDAGDAAHLVTSYGYDAAGNQNIITDPRGVRGKTVFDMLGRKTQTITAWDGTSGATPTSSTNQTTGYTYDGNNHVLTRTAVMPVGTPSQTTAWVYGVAPSAGSVVSSNDLLAEIQYPDPSTGAASTTSANDVNFTYDALGGRLTMTDRNGTTHTYAFNTLGRQTGDSVTTLGSGVSNAVLRHGFTYNTLGLPALSTSYSDTAGTTVVNQVEDVYNGLGQMTGEYQATTGAVNTSTTPVVAYGYSAPSSGSLPVSMTYPNGRILHYGYDNNALDSAIGRVDYLADDNGAGGAGSHLVDYTYLGNSAIARQALGNGNELSYLNTAGSVTGLDSFGRIVDQNYVNTASGTSTDDFQYGYDRNGNVLYKNNVVNSAFGELYHVSSTTAGDDSNAYDPLNRLTAFARGTLSASGNNTATGVGLDTVASPSTTQSWNLDGVGNQSSVSTNGSPTTNTINARNELTATGSSALTYDNEGNTLTDSNGIVYTFDAWNHLATATVPADNYTTTYGYNAAGKRITSTPSVAANVGPVLIVNDGSQQRSMVDTLTVVFPDAVTLASGAITLANSSGSESISYSNPTGDGKTWLITFTGSDVLGGSLPDGVYDLTVHSANVSGYSMSADLTWAFHRLFGDIGGQGIVNNSDLTMMRSAFLTGAGQPAFDPAFDYAGTGFINNSDVRQFNARFLHTLNYTPTGAPILTLPLTVSAKAADVSPWSATVSQTYYSGTQAIEERTGSVVTSQTVYNINSVDDVLLRDDDSVAGTGGSVLGNRLYYQHDAGFNVTALTDASGNVVQRFVYSPYGTVTVLAPNWSATTAASATPYLFQGMKQDAATGLYDTPDRDYDAATGTWREANPAGYANGSSLYQAFNSSPFSSPLSPTS